MATVDNNELIAALLRSNGSYPCYPEVAAIFRYTNPDGSTLHAVYWPGPRLSAELYAMWTSPFVIDPVLLWTQERGLTEAGVAWLLSYSVKERKHGTKRPNTPRGG